MMRTLAARSAIGLAAVSMFWSAGALALGLGDVDVRSRLNERFSALIPLLAAAPEDLDSLVVELAAPEEFARRGIDRSDLVNGLRFERVGNGIRVASPQAVRDPFLNFIVEARWNGGRLLREYTVLLDPPASAPAAAPAPAPSAGPTPLPLPGAVASGNSEAPGSYGPVQPAQTLWSIAKTLKRDPAVSMDQMLLALYNANPKAFVAGNINHLLSGIRLVVPSTAEALVTDADTARARVLELRGATSPVKPAVAAPAPAPAPVAVPAPAPQPVATPAPATPTPAPAPAPSAAVTPTTPELPPPAAAPEAAPGTPIVESAEQAATPDAAAPADPVPAPAEALPPPAAVETPPAPPVEPAPVASARPVDEAPLPWALIGGLLLLIVALVAVRLKRRAAPEQPRRSTRAADPLPSGPDPLLDRPRPRPRPADEAAADEAPTVISKPVTRAPAAAAAAAADDDEDKTALAPLAAIGAVGAAGAATLGLSVDASDPLTEADFHLAYGLYDEAAQMLKNAIAADPERTELKMKLAETWSAAGNAAEFQALAEGMVGRTSPGEWQKIAAMGRALLPESALFAASPGAATAEAVAPAASAEPLRDLSVIDFDLDAGLGRLDPPAAPAPAAVSPMVAMPDSINESLLRPIDESVLEFELPPPVVVPPPAPVPAPSPAPLAMPEPIPMPPEAEAAAAPASNRIDLLADIDLSSFDLDDDSAGGKLDPGTLAFTSADFEIAADEPLAEPEPESEVIGGDEIDTKLDLARAYADMGDLDAARSLLAEVVSGGNERQQQDARALGLRLQG